MATFHIKMAAQKQYSLSALTEQLDNNPDFDSCSKTEHHFSDSHVVLLVFEQYFVRASGTISLSVLLTETGDQQTADLIATGGGEGLSWSGGACRSFAKDCAKILQTCGFWDLDPEPETKVSKLLNFFMD